MLVWSRVVASIAGPAELSCFLFVFHEQESSVGWSRISCIAIRTETRFQACLRHISANAPAKSRARRRRKRRIFVIHVDFPLCHVPGVMTRNAARPSPHPVRKIQSCEIRLRGIALAGWGRLGRLPGWRL